MLLFHTRICISLVLICRQRSGEINSFHSLKTAHTGTGNITQRQLIHFSMRATAYGHGIGISVILKVPSAYLIVLLQFMVH